eukprot:9467651-Alexandrium_andersonii.AAC.1
MDTTHRMARQVIVDVRPLQPAEMSVTGGGTAAPCQNMFTGGGTAYVAMRWGACCPKLFTPVGLNVLMRTQWLCNMTTPVNDTGTPTSSAGTSWMLNIDTWETVALSGATSVHFPLTGGATAATWIA